MLELLLYVRCGPAVHLSVLFHLKEIQFVPASSTNSTIQKKCAMYMKVQGELLQKSRRSH